MAEKKDVAIFNRFYVFFRVGWLMSMKGAAEELGISPPTVTEYITRLEHTLGNKLFVRHQRGRLPGSRLEFTEYGAALFERISQPYRELDKVING